MPTLEESKRQVQAGLEQQALEPNHDDILASLQNEIDKHNALKEDIAKYVRNGRRRKEHHGSGDDGRGQSDSMRFRFKGSETAPRKRKRHSSRKDVDGHPKQHESRHTHVTGDEEPAEPAHPFPREPVDPDGISATTGDAAFRDSLFDALADDEGARYWESVYSQPIHVYERPTVKGPQGELERMNDEEYAAYVKTKMWERKNPEIVIERERTARRRKEEEEERTRRREEFIRRKEQAAWEKAQRHSYRRFGDDDVEPEFAGEANTVPEQAMRKQDEYAAAWARYLSAWDCLKLELLDERQAASESVRPPSKRIPWPVLDSKPVVRANIEAFMQYAPCEEGKKKSQIYKAERVRWHPDKIQQRFGGKVDEGTMKLVTGVFQVVDALYEQVR